MRGDVGIAPYKRRTNAPQSESAPMINNPTVRQIQVCLTDCIMFRKKNQRLAVAYHPWIPWYIINTMPLLSQWVKKEVTFGRQKLLLFCVRATKSSANRGKNDQK